MPGIYQPYSTENSEEPQFFGQVVDNQRRGFEKVQKSVKKRCRNGAIPERPI
jgi:hypothetical protein